MLIGKLALNHRDFPMDLCNVTHSKVTASVCVMCVRGGCVLFVFGLPEVQRKHAGWSLCHACYVYHSRTSSGQRVFEYLRDLQALQGSVICSIQAWKREISRWASSLTSLTPQVVESVAAGQLDTRGFETGRLGVLQDVISFIMFNVSFIMLHKYTSYLQMFHVVFIHIDVCYYTTLHFIDYRYDMI